MRHRGPFILIQIKRVLVFTTLCMLIPAVTSAAEIISGLTLQSYKSVQVHDEPLSYEINLNSIEIYPKHGIIIDLPESVSKKIVDQVVLIHRQSPVTDRSGVRSFKDHDSTPGYLALLFLDESFPEGQKWRFWNGPSSGPWGSKFSEVRSRRAPEAELLYAFGHYGTRSLSGVLSKEPLRTQRIALVATGIDPVYVHKIIVRFLPKSPAKIIEHIYSPKTLFDSFEKGRAQYFGGGERFYGKYPKAWRLNSRGATQVFNHSEYITATGRSIRIALPARSKISALDIACGDARGWEGRYIPGGSYLTVYWKRGETVVQNLLTMESVGAQSMLRSIPQNPQEDTREGDYLEIVSNGDTAYIMGLRLGLY